MVVILPSSLFVRSQLLLPPVLYPHAGPLSGGVYRTSMANLVSSLDLELSLRSIQRLPCHIYIFPCLCGNRTIVLSVSRSSPSCVLILVSVLLVSYLLFVLLPLVTSFSYSIPSPALVVHVQCLGNSLQPILLFPRMLCIGCLSD